MVKRAPLTARRAQAAERRMRVWRLRTAGASYAQIAKAEGISEKTVLTDINIVLGELARTASNDAEEWRRSMIANLRELHYAYYPRALGGDYAAFDRILRIEEALARLLGVDVAPAAAPPILEYVIEVVAPTALPQRVIDVTPTRALDA